MWHLYSLQCHFSTTLHRHKSNQFTAELTLSRLATTITWSEGLGGNIGLKAGRSVAVNGWILILIGCKNSSPSKVCRTDAKKVHSVKLTRCPAAQKFPKLFKCQKISVYYFSRSKSSGLPLDVSVVDVRIRRTK